jgi:23S rRNA (guanosine2251-2'-O)-methyltransferase
MARSPKRPPAGHAKPRSSRPASARRRPGTGDERVVLYGRHAVMAALANPHRPIHRVSSLGPPDDDLAAAAAARGLGVDALERGAFAAIVGDEAAHQGMACVAADLPEPDLHALAHAESGLLVVLDQVSDSRNVGAILRSAAAFGATALIMQTRHAAPLNGACAKAASGALEWVPVVHEVNLARTLTQLQGDGWWVAGLTGDGEVALADFTPAPKQVLVLGAEGRGLRHLIRERCDRRLRIPLEAPVESLNVAVTAGIALSHCAMRRATTDDA